jgi:membrane protease YdiL (CAAX protease family)
MNVTTERNGTANYLSTIVIFILFGGIIGAATFITLIPQNTRTVLKFGMAIISLATWFFSGRSERFQPYKQFAISFFAISLGVLLAQYFGDIPMRLFNASITTVRGVALAKVGEALPVILSILVFHFATGGDMNGLFLRKGNLRLGLTAGILGFAFFASIGLLQVIGSGLQWAIVAKALPWILTFTFSNALMEELWFRASFLKKLEPLVGIRTTLIITSLVFAGIHISSTYVIDILVFMVALMALGLLWSWLMNKADSIWGPVLIHAGGDVLVILGFLAGANL